MKWGSNTIEMGHRCNDVMDYCGYKLMVYTVIKVIDLLQISQLIST